MFPSELQMPVKPVSVCAAVKMSRTVREDFGLMLLLSFCLSELGIYEFIMLAHSLVCGPLLNVAISSITHDLECIIGCLISVISTSFTSSLVFMQIQTGLGCTPPFIMLSFRMSKCPISSSPPCLLFTAWSFSKPVGMCGVLCHRSPQRYGSVSQWLFYNQFNGPKS